MLRELGKNKFECERLRLTNLEFGAQKPSFPTKTFARKIWC